VERARWETARMLAGEHNARLVDMFFCLALFCGDAAMVSDYLVTFRRTRPEDRQAMAGRFVAEAWSR